MHSMPQQVTYPSRSTGMAYLLQELTHGDGNENCMYIDAQDSYGRTPLSTAAASGHEAVVKLLVERDDVVADSKDKDGWTPLLWAAQRGHEAVVKLLVERDDVLADSKDKDGRTPLSSAAARGHEAVVKLLVEWGGRTS
jgi:ankyrin repeat protein